MALLYNLGDEVSASLIGFEKKLIFQYQQALLYSPCVESEFVLQKKKEYDFVFIDFAPNYLNQWEVSQFFPSFFQKAEAKEPALRASVLLISTEVTEVITNLFNPSPKFAVEMCREAKVLEMLDHFVKSQNGAVTQTSLDNDDMVHLQNETYQQSLAKILGG